MERVKVNTPYFYLMAKNGRFEVAFESDMLTIIDEKRYESGNYFTSFEGAAEYCDFINELLKERRNA